MAQEYFILLYNLDVDVCTHTQALKLLHFFQLGFLHKKRARLTIIPEEKKMVGDVSII